MRLILKRKEVINFPEERGLNDETTKVVWANVGSAQGSQVILAFNQKGFFTILLTPMGKIDGDVIVVERNEISSIRFKKGLMAYKVIVESLNGSDIPPFRVNKMMMGYKEQKEDLQDLLERYPD